MSESTTNVTSQFTPCASLAALGCYLQQILTRHGPNCASHYGKPCGCLPTYTLRRQPRKGERGR